MIIIIIIIIIISVCVIVDGSFNILIIILCKIVKKPSFMLYVSISTNEALLASKETSATS